MVRTELALLKSWLQPSYLSSSILQQIAKTFSQQQYIQLADFFQEKQVLQIVQGLQLLSWKHSYNPDMHSYSHAPIDPLKDFSAFLRSPVFCAFVGTLVGKDVKKITAEAFLFQHGDYTLLHDAEQRETGVLFWFDFTQEWDSAAGGQTIVVHRDAPLIFAPKWNSLQLIHLQKQQQFFTKYVNAFAGKKKLVLVRGMLQ
jgi:Rps23 Pro-64 3,4-dihydroxylase Tpa1-like proline 4-hydroxylase